MWWNREELIRSLSWNSQSVGQKNWAFKVAGCFAEMLL